VDNSREAEEILTAIGEIIPGAKRCDLAGNIPARDCTTPCKEEGCTILREGCVPLTSQKQNSEFSDSPGVNNP